MPDPEELFARMGDYNAFLADLGTVPAEVTSAPMTQGKWSIQETVSHITAWDAHFLETAVRSIEVGEPPNLADTVDYQVFNERAAVAGRLLPKHEVLSQAAQTRTRLLVHLRRLPAEWFRHQGQPGGELMEFLERNFVSHDRHHVAQMKDYLAKHPS